MNNQSRLTVLQFTPSLSLKDGGTTTYMLQLAPSLGQLVDLHICTLGSRDDLPVDLLPRLNAKVYLIPSSLKMYRKMKQEWISLLVKLHPDIVHVNCCWMPQCALVQRWTKQMFPEMPVFLTPHGMLEPWIISRNYWTRKVPAILLYQRKAVAQASALVATADSERQHLLDLGWNHRVEMVPNGINAHSIEMKEDWSVRHHLLFMSRIHPKKGLELLMKALKDDYRLTIAGEGEPQYVEQLKQLAKSLKIADRCEFVGGVYNQRKWQLIRECDAVVLPTYSENFGLIVAEALASGTPVVTTTGTPWQELPEKQCGWWVEPKVESLQVALSQLSQMSEQKLKEMGCNGRKLIEERYDVMALAKRLVDVYCQYTQTK